MEHARFLPLIEWIAAAGLSGQSELGLLQGFCERAVGAGLPLSRAVIGIDTLHPVLEGRLFEWYQDGAPVQSEYGRLDPERSDDKCCKVPSMGSTKAARNRCAGGSTSRIWSSLCWRTCGARA